MPDELTIPETEECVIRTSCLHGALAFFSLSGTKPKDSQAVIDVAMLFEHYVDEGGSIAFQCTAESAKAVR